MGSEPDDENMHRWTSSKNNSTREKKYTKTQSNRSALSTKEMNRSITSSSPVKKFCYQPKAVHLAGATGRTVMFLYR